jgi:radical SAM superfamily enzyme YgiQ (UPF0313 family)
MGKQKYEKVMLINPPNTMPKNSVRRLTTPLGLMYLGAALKENGYEVNILDTTCEGYFNTISSGEMITYGLSDREILQKIDEYNPDIVGITSMFTAHQANSLNTCSIIKSNYPNLPIVIGGIHPSLNPVETINNPYIDYVVIGEGEYRFVNLLSKLNKNQLPDFDGIAYKNKGRVRLNPMFSRITDLDKLPFPARDLVNIENYIQIGVPFGPFSRKDRVEQILTTRGCPFSCNFCSTVEYWGHHFRTRSVENVINEIDELVSKYHIQEIQFTDDNLTANKKRAKEFFRKLRQYNISWSTPNGLMIQTLDEEMINLMAESGAYQVSFAVESGSQRVLREIINKKVPSKLDVQKYINGFHKNNVQVHGLFIVGFPGEAREEIQQTLDYPFELGFDSASFFIAHPMPGSRLYRECEQKGYLEHSLIGKDLQHSAIKIPKNSPDFVMHGEELEKLVDDTTRKLNEHIKYKNPDAWEKKFEQFLKKHGDKTNLILGRVT